MVCRAPLITWSVMGSMASWDMLDRFSCASIASSRCDGRAVAEFRDLGGIAAAAAALSSCAGSGSPVRRCGGRLAAAVIARRLDGRSVVECGRTAVEHRVGYGLAVGLVDPRHLERHTSSRPITRIVISRPAVVEMVAVVEAVLLVKARNHVVPRFAVVTLPSEDLPAAQNLVRDSGIPRAFGISAARASPRPFSRSRRQRSDQFVDHRSADRAWRPDPRA